MMFDGFDAAVLIEPSLPLPIENQGATDQGMTLDVALAQLAPVEQGVSRGVNEILNHSAAMDEARIVDLWGAQSARTLAAPSNETPFGPLMIEELNKSGADRASLESEEGQTVIVDGPPRPNPGTGTSPWFVFNPGNPGGGGPFTGGGGTGSGSSAPGNTDVAYTDDDANCLGSAVLKAGAKITQLVSSMGNYEYTGVVVKNSNDTYGMSNDELYTTFELKRSSFDNLGNYANAFGVVHNHTFNSQDYNDNFIQRYPSREDWQSLDRMVQGGANPANLSVYVLDPFGTMREFKFSDRAMYEAMSDTERMQVNGPNLPPATTGCGG